MKKQQKEIIESIIITLIIIALAIIVINAYKYWDIPEKVRQKLEEKCIKNQYGKLTDINIEIDSFGTRTVQYECNKKVINELYFLKKICTKSNKWGQCEKREWIIDE